MTTTITFIKNPPYSVDFRQFAPVKIERASLTKSQKVQAVAFGALLLVKYYFESLAHATFVTLKYSGTSFKHIVLNLNGEFRLPVADIALIVLRLGVWVLSMSWCLVTTTNRECLKKFYGESYDTNKYIENFVEEGINIGHIRSNEIELDASKVPSDVKVDNLKTIFDEIDFENADKPNYMSPNVLKEYKAIIPINVAKEQLERFVDYVNRRVAFLGTPPEYDTPRLLAFYQQIESAVRLSIHKSNERIAEFKRNNAGNPESYNADQKKEYRSLLEDRARIAIDLAIAGKHCGARFMGDSTSVYNYFYVDALKTDKTLEELLVDILAKKRKEIAEQQIQTHFGMETKRDNQGHTIKIEKPVDTHDWNNYMSTMGHLLAIPGTKNIIEHLASPLDKDTYLKPFFKEYTVKTIIEEIQESAKKSGTLFTKIVDWVKAHVNDWNAESLQRLLQEKVDTIQKILNEKEEVAPENNPYVTDFEELINLLKNNNIELPKMDDWDDFLQDLLALKEAKEWLTEKYPHSNPNADQRQKLMAIQRRKREMIAACSEDVLGLNLFNQVKELILNGTPIPKHLLSEQVVLEKKFEKVKNELPGDTDADIIASLKTKIEKINDSFVITDTAPILGYLDRQRGVQFVNTLFEKFETEGLSEEMLEWILVSQNILHPQLSEEGV